MLVITIVHNRKNDQLPTISSPCEVADEADVGDLVESFSGSPADDASVGAVSAGNRVGVVDMVSAVSSGVQGCEDGSVSGT